MAISEHETKMFSLQQQVRQNQSELEDFVKEMNSWEEEVKKKEADVLTKKTEKSNDLPPVRNCMFKKKKKKVKKPQTEDIKPKRISGYDYRKWDKFDVDKELEKMEDKKSESSEYETDEEWEIERKKHMATLEKEKGNDCFKRQEYGQAIEAYTKAMELDPTNAILPANRAMALLKQEKYGAAESDCIHSLTLDPLYVKAYLRLGAARFGLKRFDVAKEAFEKVLKLEPQNKTAQKELERIEKELTKDKMVEQKDTTKSPDEGLVKPITKPLSQRSKKPLVRIQIEEIGGEDDKQRRAAIEEVQKSQSEAKKQITSKDNQMFEKFTSDNSKNAKNTESDSRSVTSDKSSGDSRLKAESVKLNLNGISDNHPESKSVSPRSMPVPTSSFQFQTDYKSLKNDLQSFYLYVKKINPEEYPKLFGQFLDAGTLLNMLNVFKECFIPSRPMTKEERLKARKALFASARKPPSTTGRGRGKGRGGQGKGRGGRGGTRGRKRKISYGSDSDKHEEGRNISDDSDSESEDQRKPPTTRGRGRGRGGRGGGTGGRKRKISYDSDEQERNISDDSDSESEDQRKPPTTRGRGRGRGGRGGGTGGRKRKISYDSDEQERNISDGSESEDQRRKISYDSDEQERNISDGSESEDQRRKISYDSDEQERNISDGSESEDQLNFESIPDSDSNYGDLSDSYDYGDQKMLMGLKMLPLKTNKEVDGGHGQGDDLEKEESDQGDDLEKEESDQGDDLEKEESDQGDDLEKEESDQGDIIGKFVQVEIHGKKMSKIYTAKVLKIAESDVQVTFLKDDVKDANLKFWGPEEVAWVARTDIIKVMSDPTWIERGRDYRLKFVAEEDFYQHMVHLSKVKRFNMTVMFFSKKEQTVIKDLVQHLEKTGKISSTDIQKLKKTYEIS